MLAERQSGTLSSTIKSKPREHVKAITLRSSKQLASPLSMAYDDVIMQDKPARKEPELEYAQLADRTVKYPRGIVEDVLVKVDKFIFHVDFVVMDMEGETSVPLILGRPFLATSRTVIDVCDGKLQLRVGDETITFDFSTFIRHSLDHNDTADDEKELSNEDVLELAYLLKLRPSLEEPPALELKELPKHLTYAYLDEAKKLLVIIAADLTHEERKMTFASLRKYPKVFSYKIADIPRINPIYCLHKILMEDNCKLVVQPQRRLNPNMKEVVKKEVMPKKRDMTVVKNEKDEMIPTRTELMSFGGGDTTSDRARADGEVGTSPIESSSRPSTLAPSGSSSTVLGVSPIEFKSLRLRSERFLLHLRTKRKPLSLAPMRCMMAVFHDMIEESMEVFMDEFSVFGNSSSYCLLNLERMLACCVEANLVLNWKKCHFMVRESIVLGHKISHAGMEVDRAKVETIAKLPPPSSVKAVRSFLGHAGFYRRFIKDFSKIARPLTQLLVKDVPFIFSDDYLQAFELLKEKLTTTPIMQDIDRCPGALYHYKERVACGGIRFRQVPLILGAIQVRSLHGSFSIEKFDIEIKDKKGAENLAVDHLSRLENPSLDALDERAIDDSFPNEYLCSIQEAQESLVKTVRDPTGVPIWHG
ncbi:uncharacterized protein LOC125370637 [Ricinus communis]|uniref:uncharacterized protein LOC125370637 n=1 Tax=Ricinus communis TaxID=3988 RepID=UPI00201AD77A|nr:uncharacterized protein LOC125370637 [Ricinus communis]